jgi:hypothetical protein
MRDTYFLLVLSGNKNPLLERAFRIGIKSGFLALEPAEQAKAEAGRPFWVDSSRSDCHDFVNLNVG